MVPFARLAAVAAAFRAAAFKGAAVVNDLESGPELVDFLPARPRCLPAVALDLGTTLLEATLVDLLTGATLARATRENGQIEHGADILARIHFAGRRDPDSGSQGLVLLQRTVIADLNALILDLASRSSLDAGEIRAVSVAGNTTMVHFLLGLDPRHLCREPYIPVVNAPDPCRGIDLDLAIHPGGVVWVLPSRGSYFGGDLVAGILATGLDRHPEPAMLIDVGTNAEVVVGNRDWLIACAGAAGPALEGGVARMGMRAGPGAVDHVTIDPLSGELRYSTIDRSPARGICGSGLIDLVAGLYLARGIDMRGKFRTAGLLPAIRERLRRRDDGMEYVVAIEGAEDVALGQTDLDALMRSKAAMYAILTTITRQVGLEFRDLERIYVAGAFGQHIAPRQAIVLGMLPDLDPAIFAPQGNTSLAGAEKVLLDGDIRKRCREVAERITYMELNVNQEFMMRFSGGRFIPHTDRTLFPSVPFFKDE